MGQQNAVRIAPGVDCFHPVEDPRKHAV
jgi:hypothetical protein